MSIWIRAQVGRVALVLIAVLAATFGPEGAVGGEPVYQSKPPKGEPWERNWCSSGGGPARTRRVDVEPIRNQPVVAWEIGPDPYPLAKPVVWDGVVFVIAQEKTLKPPTLLALDARTGKQLARAVCFGMEGEAVRLLVWQSVCVVLGDKRTQAYAYRGSGLKRDWDAAFGGSDESIVFQGILFAAGDDACVAHDLRNGRELPLPRMRGMSPVIVADRDSWSVVTVRVNTHPTYVGFWCFLDEWRLSGVGGDVSKVTATKGLESDLGYLDEMADTRTAVVTSAVQFGGQWGLLALSSVPFRTTKGTSNLALWHPSLSRAGARGGAASARFVGDGLPPTVTSDGFYSVNKNDAVLSVGPDGGYRTFVEKDAYPIGSWTGTPSMAREVVYPGNWAIDTSNLRIVWTFPLPRGEKSALPLIPSGDGLALLCTQAPRIVCLADPILAKAAGTAVAAGADAGAVTPKPDLPGAGDGVYLTTGRWLAGRPTVGADRSVSVVGADGATKTAPAAEVVAAIADGKVIAAGDEPSAFAAVRVAVGRAWGERLVGVFDEAVRLELPVEAQEVLDEARRAGLPASRAADLSRKLAGRRVAASPEPRRVGLAKARAPIELAGAAEGAATAKWLAAAGFPAASAAVADQVSVAIPSWTGAAAHIASIVPSSFPWAGEQSAGARYRRWAKWLAATGARFLPPDAKELTALQGPVWKQGAIGMRTANILLVSRVQDPDVVGPCLLRAETTVENLEALLGGRPAQQVTAGPGGKTSPPAEEAPLVIRLLGNRNEYLTEAGDGAGMEWTVGYFSPSEKISRFYLAAKEDALISAARELNGVLAHELTHHWVDVRWIRYRGLRTGRSPLVPGYWVVEGLATFIEHQVADIDTRGVSFRDPTVQCVDTANACLREGYWYKPSELASWRQSEFGKLSTVPKATVKLTKNTLSLKLSDRNLFYDASAALVYFLINERGDTGRQWFVRYLEEYYSGRTTQQPWLGLGYKTAAELNSEFETWLASALR